MNNVQYQPIQNRFQCVKFTANNMLETVYVIAKAVAREVKGAYFKLNYEYFIVNKKKQWRKVMPEEDVLFAIRKVRSLKYAHMKLRHDGLKVDYVIKDRKICIITLPMGR